MIEIVKATVQDSKILAVIGKRSFVESHGHSAAQEDLDTYINGNLGEDKFREELADPTNFFHIIYHDGLAAGYSKIILNSPHPAIQFNEVTKLERLYLLKEFYGLKIGYELLKYVIELSKRSNQAGIWLFVWKENHKAIDFYMKSGFKIIGSYDFKISETHSNPNYHMLLEY